MWIRIMKKGIEHYMLERNELWMKDVAFWRWIEYIHSLIIKCIRGLSKSNSCLNILLEFTELDWNVSGRLGI